MERLSDIRVWEPEESGALKGTLCLEGGLNWAVRTEDGTRWLFADGAERQLQALDPDEGQTIQVIFVLDGYGEPTYHVNLV
jgi:hypothetical protein